MKDKRCLICKFQGHGEKRQDTYPNRIFGSASEDVMFLLCYAHSVEFFKSGQMIFFERYAKLFDGQYGIENDERVIEAAGLSKIRKPGYDDFF